MAEQRRRRRLSSLPRVSDLTPPGKGSPIWFAKVAAHALASLPAELRTVMSNVEISVEEEPTRADLAEAGLGPNDSMYGFYRGVPLTSRTIDYNFALPDRIEIYRRPLMRDFPSERALERQIQRTVVHEIAHHFGIDDARLTELGWG